MKTILHTALIAFVVFGVAGSAWGVPPADWRDVRAKVLKTMRADTALEREAAFEPLLGHDHRDAVELLMKAISSTKTSLAQKQKARDVLGSFRSEESREEVFRALRSKPAGSYLLLEAFAAMEDERAPAAGEAALRAARDAKNEVPITAAAIGCLVATGEPSAEAVGAILKYAGEGQPVGWRLAATEALLKVRSPAAIETLVGLVDDPGVGAHVRRLLVRLAGKDLGSLKSEWEEWLAGTGGALPGEDSMSSDEARAIIDAHVNTQAEMAAEADRVSFYGVPIEGKNVLFVLDASSSMRGYPFERLQSECRALVDQLPESHKLALLFFPGNDTFPRAMELATPEMKKKAHSFIEKRKISRGTPVGEAMTAGYKRYVGKTDVDAIYLISDGAPSKPISEMLALIDDLNAGHYIPIHTIYIGQVEAIPGEAPPEEMALPVGPIRTGWGFLKEVARRNEGKFAIVVP